MRNLKIIFFLLLIVGSIGWTWKSLHESTTARRERDNFATALRELDQCSKDEIKQQFASDPRINVAPLLKAVSLKCRTQYIAYIDLMSAVPPPKKDWLSQKVEKALANRNAENDRTRKAALIEEAVQRLATAGITEDDIKDYFRESILEEERNQ